jgi:hypothetical protein
VFSQFLEAQELNNILSGETLHRQILVPVDYTSYETFHNLLFSLYTNLISALDYGKHCFLRPQPEAPPYCDVEEFFSLADRFQLQDIRDRLRDWMVKVAEGKYLVKKLFGKLSFQHLDLQQAYYKKFKEQWTPSTRKYLFEVIDEMDDDVDREGALRLMGNAIVDMTFGELRIDGEFSS